MSNPQESQVSVFTPAPPPTDRKAQGSEQVDYIRELLELLAADALAHTTGPENE